MTHDSTFDRRSFLRWTSSAGLLGLAGVASSRSRVRQTGGDEVALQGDDDGITYFQAVVPAGRLLDADLVYKILVVGGPIQPGQRPPPLCFPEGEEQWRARDAVVVDPTETSGVIGGDTTISAVDRSRAYLEQPVEPGSVFRITGGEFCDGHALLTIHELPPELSEYFSTRALDMIDGTLQGVANGNETAGNGTVGNGTIGNGFVGSAPDENENGRSR